MLEILKNQMSNPYGPMMDQAVMCEFGNITDLDSRFLSNRLVENDKREIVLISKTPAEVFGEQLLAPVIEKITPIVSQVISMLGTALQIPMQLAQSVSFPSLLPTVSAQPIATSHSTMEVIALLDRIRSQMPASNQPELQEDVDSSIYVTEIQNVFDLILTSYGELQWKRLDIPFLSSLRDREGNSLVLAAVKQGKEAELIHTLLENKIGFENLDPEGHSPLQLAAKLGHTHLIDLLSDHFSVDAKDSSQPAPMDLTIIEGHEDTFKELVSMTGLTKGAKTSNGIQFSSLELSVVFGRHSMFKKLRKKSGAQLNQFNGKVGNLLHLAIHAGQVEMMDTILELTRDRLLEQKDLEGRTPLHLAAYLGDLEAIRKIGTILKKPNILGGQKWTPLHWAAHGKQPEAVKLLWKMGGKPQLNNANHQSPLSLPSLQGARSNPEARRTIAQLEKCLNRDAHREPLSPLDTYFYPRQLVISGTGEVLSAVDQIQDTEGMDYVSRIGGISRGSFTAALMAIGLSGPELEQTLAKGFDSLEQGIDPFTEWLESVIKDETNTPDCTFEELARLSEDSPAKYKELYLYAQNQEEVVFCAEDDQWKNLIISEGVTGAIAPSTGKYSPFFKHAGKERHTVPSIGTFFDASELVSEPAALFDKHYYLGKTAWGSPTNRATLELRGATQTEESFSGRTIYCTKAGCHPKLSSEEGRNFIRKSFQQPISSWEEMVARFSKIEPPHHISSKTQIFNYPLPPKDFTGRKQELELLHEKCKSHQRVAITGLGGMGKTALSLKYAKQHQSHYEFIHFVDSASISQGLLKLADDLKIPAGDPQERLEWLKVALNRRDSEYLIIFDEIDHPEKFEELEPLLPNRGKCLLLTSRMSEKARSLDFEVMKLDLLKAEEAIDYLVNHTEDKNRSSASKLAEELGYLPLALKQAASYIRKVGISFEKYLDLHEKHQLLLFEEARLPLKKEEQTILTTWKISLSAIEASPNGPLAKKTLEFLSSLGQAPISVETIEQWHKNTFPESADLDLIEALGLLSSYSMIEHPVPDTSSVHTLVKKVTLREFTENQRQELFKQAIEILTRMRREYCIEAKANRVRLAHFKTHILAVAKMLDDDSIEAADMFSELAHQESLAANYEGELVYQQQALKLRKKQFGRKHPEVATSLDHVGTALKNLNRHQESLDFFEQALQLREELFGLHHADVATSLSHVGAILHSLGEYQKGLEYSQQALKLRKELFGLNHADVSSSLSQMANLLKTLGRYQDALEYSYQALMLDKKLYCGDNHPVVATDLLNMGIILCEIGEHEEALKFAYRALEVNTKLVGENGIATLNSREQIGTILASSGKHEDALVQFKQVLKQKEKIFGSKDPNTASALLYTGHALLALGKDQEGLVYQQEAIDLYKKQSVSNNIEIGMMLSTIGVNLISLNRYEEALESLIQSFKIVCKSTEDIKYKEVVLCPIIHLGHQNNPELAKKIKAEILPLAIEQLGQNHYRVKLLENIGKTGWDWLFGRIGIMMSSRTSN